MGLEDEFMLQLSYITQTLNLTAATELVDPSEAIVRYGIPWRAAAHPPPTHPRLETMLNWR